MGISKKNLLDAVREWSRAHHTTPEFAPGESHVPYAGRVFDEEEVVAAASSVLDFWLTLGEEGKQLEKELAAYLGTRASVLTNSGSSANLLAISALTSSKLGSQALTPGDEVITVACGFPTTVAPIVQCGCVPVFVDVDPCTLAPNLNDIEDALSDRTRAVFIAHALGNPFDAAAVAELAHKYGLWFIEDNCDALGGTLGGRYTGTFGHLSTQSFYPPHHITMGEGGAINVVKRPLLKTVLESFRDWGRDCWCASGCDNTCGKRFDWRLGELPDGYDHKYIYSHLGFNLKPLDVQAAIGRVQLGRISEFVEKRRDNWTFLRDALAELEDVFEFMKPIHAREYLGEGSFLVDDDKPESVPSWFGFMMLVREEAPFSRREFASFLDSKNIGNRGLFGGNLVRQPAFVELKKNRPDAFRVHGSLLGSDRVMNEAVFVGVYPGLKAEMLEYMVSEIHQYVRSRMT